MSSKKLCLMALAVLLVLAVSSVATLAASTTTPSKKFGLILATGGLGDQSFNDLTFQGLQKAKKDLGITFDYVEPKEIADYETYQREMAKSGEYALIITVGFDQADALKKVATDYPKQKFAIIDMAVDAPNVASYLSEEQEGSFLVGALVGLMKAEKANPKLNKQSVTGVVGGMDIPLIRKFIAGYMAGARYVNPNMKVLYDFVGDWSDPTTAKEISLALNNKGADFIYHAAGGSGLGVFQAAKEKDFFAIGCNSNQNHLDPNHIVASMLKRVDVACYSAVQDVLKGTFKAGVHSLGIKQGGIDFTLTDSKVAVPASIVKKLEDLKTKIKNGTIVVPVNIEDVDKFLKNTKK